MILAFFAFQQVKAQTATKILSIDSISQLEPIIMNDTVDFLVLVSINDTSFVNNDTITGDLFYYYQTDSMINAGAPPRIFNQYIANETISGSFFDTISIDIFQNEIRTSPPVNLIILWPAIITTNPEVIDSTQIELEVYFEGYLHTPHANDNDEYKVIFPIPASQYIYVRPEEIQFIRQIHLLTVDGKIVGTKQAEEISSGLISIDHLPTGTYFVQIEYRNGEIIQSKMIKN